MIEWQLPLLGGLLISLSSSLLLWGIGRISGISGIIGNVITSRAKGNGWRYAWLLGLIFGSFIYFQIAPGFFSYEFNFSTPKLIIAGLLIGFGTRLGSGCTSGHGVCGLARLSIRSFVSVITFIVSGIITVYLVRVL
jgi:uncharacterized protein